jgi:hypothetical protein
MTINSDQSVLRAGPGVAPPLARAAGAAAAGANAILSWSTPDGVMRMADDKNS